MSDGFISNRQLKLADVPAGDANDDEIERFAGTFDGYAVWGNLARCFDVGRSVRDAFGPPATDLPATSLLRLRTALFTAVRARHFVDLDGDVEWDLANFPAGREPPSASTPSSADTFMTHLRQLTDAVRQVVGLGPTFHLAVARAVVAAAAALQRQAAPKEKDLRIAVATALAELVDEPIASSASGHEAILENVPGWETPPGPFDLVLGVDEQHPRLIAELKWANVNTLSHSLWEIVKIVGVLAKAADGGYLIAGYPTQVWHSKSPFTALYRDGLLKLTELPLEREWPWIVAHSAGVPVALPRQIDVTEVCRVSLFRQNQPWELRAVAIEPAQGGWLHLPNGDLGNAVPLAQVDD